MSATDVRTGLREKWAQETGVVKKTLRAGLAELIGTSIMIFLGCMGCVGSLGVVPSHPQISLTFGLAVMIVIQCIGHISDAHINPAITIASVILGKKTILESLIYIVAQMIGGVFGYGMLKLVTPEDHLTANTANNSHLFCVNNLHPDVSAFQGFIGENIATSILVFLVCAVWDPRNEKNTDSTPIKFGFTITVMAMAFGPYTGCSMNPARSFAPALWNNQWSHHWIYWVGPISGALATSFTYKILFGVRDEINEDESAPEAIPFNSVEAHKTERQAIRYECGFCA